MEHLTGTMDILRSWGVAHHVRPARARLSLCCLACCKPDLTDILPTVAVFQPATVRRVTYHLRLCRVRRTEPAHTSGPQGKALPQPWQ